VDTRDLAGVDVDEIARWVTAVLQLVTPDIARE
jgi:hypothetical protein